MKQLLSVASLSILLLSGCASIFGDNNKTVEVRSTPQNAQVFANNQPVGVTPTIVTVPSTWSPTLLTLKKKGFQTQTTQVMTAFQPVGLWNILFWPGFIVDAISGDMMKIKPESRNIHVDLSKPV
ncbi:hypothetical protein AYO45_02195 [Gammaproteobacteria bacterium SCGC AG-212-F23]|nr:hypothetical protein AYO45_02195 [Gammaproteobacteria bacterium SCGC AG-212-F23]